MLGLVGHLKELTAPEIKLLSDQKSALPTLGRRVLAYAEQHRDDPDFQHAAFHADLSGLGQMLAGEDQLRRYSDLTNHITRAQVSRCLADAKAGKVFAQLDLASVYRFGRFGVTPNSTEAATWYRRAAEQGSAIGEVNLAGMYERGEGVTQSFGEAAKWYRRAGAQGSTGHRNSLAWFLATCPDETVRDGSEAITLAERVVAATGRKEADFLDTLAAAYAETGRFAEAVRTQKEAIALLHDENKKADFEARLKLFESGVPFHQPLGHQRYGGIELEEPEK